ncbi:MAG TPA: ABC transporter substrate-binding protein [Aliidongia sp.]|nr:ABC transporter substrate-binding protein [Aliidongia sp.]
MRTALLALTALLLALPAAASELRIALQDDPDTLDPALNWSFVGRHVLQSVCDKLVDIDTEGAIVPMLAVRWRWSADGLALSLELREGVRFQDGEPFDAEAVKFNLEREMTLPGSRRRSEIAVLDHVEVTGPLAVTLHLREPSVPLLALFTDRAGMMVSPKAARAEGEQFGQHPVCAGPYRFTERVAQDWIVLDRDPGYWRADAYKFDRLIYAPMPDGTVRLTNLKAHQVDIVDRLPPGAVAEIKADPALAVAEGAGLSYSGLTFNIANGPHALPAFANPLVRQAISLAIDRNALNEVVFDERYEAGNQPFAPSSPWYDPALPVPARDVAAAKAKLAQAGVSHLGFELLMPPDPLAQQEGQMIQAMLAEIGIEVKLVTSEFITMLDRARRGDFEADLVGWSGRVDPDLNISPLLACGAAGNDGHYCSDALAAILAAARATPDMPVRKAKYDEAVRLLAEDAPIVYLYHARSIFGLSAHLVGFKTYPDGILRLDGVTNRP